MKSAIILALTLSSSAFAAPNPLYDALKQEMPVGKYVGKQHSGKECVIDVKETKNKEYGHLYTITTTFTPSGKKQSFEFREKNETFEKIQHPNYVGEHRKNKEESRTSLAVGRGVYMDSPETYWEGYEKELYFDIEVREKQKGFKGPAWRVIVSAMNAGKIGAGGLTCHILPLHQ